ncbi:MAG: hypothetical protein QNJ45_12360 [Ardenticatenaceae bacterium]|nr:hypothetical protein [Ardenticatenaceae bacterium]
MDLFNILRNVPWRPGIGDPSLAGWLTVFTYFAVGILAVVYYQRQQAGGRPRRTSAIWLLIAFLLFFLGLNKQLDLQSLLTAIGREVAKTQGWYGDRRGVQLAFIGVLAAGGGLVMISLAWLWRQTIRQHGLIFLGLGALFFFVLIRAVSFHAVDLIIQQRVLGVRFNTILELGSLILIGFGLWQAIKISRGESGLKRPAASARMVVPAVAGVLALAGAAAVFQLLSSDTFDWTSDFEAVVEPYQHSDPPGPSAADPVTFTAAFESFPDQPTPFESPDWDITVHTRDWSTWDQIEPMTAVYGSDCTPYPATHPIATFEESVFGCDGRLISAINGSEYAATIVTPAYLVDFSQEEAVISFDMSTVRTSGRDWIEIWITPIDDHLQLPGQDWMPDMNGHPQNAVHFYIDLGSWRFFGRTITAGQVTELSGDWFALDEQIEPSYIDLTTFQIHISGDHVRFGVPAVDQWWVNTPLTNPLIWEQGVVQISHHSFDPTKDCEELCQPNSWVFDNVTVDPAVPFTLIQTDTRFINRGTGPAITLHSSTPDHAYLRFVAFADEVQLSFDQGNTWQAALRQQYAKDDIGYQSYWTPIPPGVEEVHFRARDFGGNDWQIRDISVWGIGD